MRGESKYDGVRQSVGVTRGRKVSSLNNLHAASCLRRLQFRLMLHKTHLRVRSREGVTTKSLFSYLCFVAST